MQKRRSAGWAADQSSQTLKSDKFSPRVCTTARYSADQKLQTKKQYAIDKPCAFPLAISPN